MALRLLCTTHCCEGNMFNYSTTWRKQEERTRTWMKTAQSRSTAHHVEQQDMSMIVRVICWELECANRKDGDHQQEIALAALAWSGPSGRREGIETPQGPTAKRSATSC